MTEIEGNNPSHDLPDDPFLLHRPTAIDEAYAHARNLEETLNTFEGSEEERHALAESILPHLNSMYGYVGRSIIVEGDVVVNSFDPTTLSVEFPPDTNQETRSLNGKVVRSLGYIAIDATDHPKKHMYVRHVAETMPQQITPGGRFGAAFQSFGLEIPIDGSVEVRLQGEIMPPHKQLLQREIPAIIKQVDEALETDGSLTQKLCGLSKINIKAHETLHGKGGEDTKEELLYYLNKTLEKTMKGIHRIKGAEAVIIPTLSNERRDVLSNGADSDLILCHLVGIRFSPDDRATLALTTLTQLKDRGLFEVVYPLTDKLEVEPVGEMLVNLQDDEDG